MGNPSRRIRDELWLKACRKVGEYGCVMQLWSARNEQGFQHRQYGSTDHVLLDYEGLVLVTKLRRKAKTGKPVEKLEDIDEVAGDSGASDFDG